MMATCSWHPLAALMRFMVGLVRRMSGRFAASPGASAFEKAVLIEKYGLNRHL